MGMSKNQKWVAQSVSELGTAIIGRDDQMTKKIKDLSILAKILAKMDHNMTKNPLDIIEIDYFCNTIIKDQ